MTGKKKQQSSIENEERKKSNAEEGATPRPASKSDVPYLNDDGLMDLSLIPDEVWRRQKRWKRLPGKEPRTATRREKEWKPKPYRPRRRHR
jgi:hypothetical protein